MGAYTYTLLPNQCLCGESLLEKSMSVGAGCITYHTCSRCERQACTLHYGMKVRVLSSGLGQQISATARAWIYGDLTTTLEAMLDRVRVVQGEASRQEWCLQMDLIGEPHDCRIGFVEDRRVLLRPDNTEVPDILLRVLDAARHRRTPAPAVYDLLHDLPGLPNLPEDVKAFFWDPKAQHWYSVNTEASSKLKVPPHPVRVWHDKRWKAIFQQLEVVLDTWTKVEIENGYDKSPHKPWYRLEVPGACLTVGPRRHVDAIVLILQEDYLRQHDRECEGWFQRIYALGERDKVTFNADWRPSDDASGKRVFEVIIHAYNNDKVVEYIKTLFGYEE